VYPVRPDNTVWFTAVDFDGKHEADWRERAAKVYTQLVDDGFSPLLEISQSGEGAHVWMLLDQPTPAADARAFWRDVLDRASVSCREIFPKQDELSGKGLGNLIRFPLHGASRFCDVDWQELDPTATLSNAKRHTLPPRVVPAAPPQVVAPGVSPRVATLISAGPIKNRWDGIAEGLEDGSRSSVAMSLACHLVRAYVPTSEIEDALRAWGREHDYTDKTDRRDWLTRTLNRAYEHVAGRAEETSRREDTLLDCVVDAINSHGARAHSYCPSGIPALDAAMDGVAPGEMCVVAARPSHGKSAFALQWAIMQAERGVPVLFLSEEMGRNAIGNRGALRILPGGIGAHKVDDALAIARKHYGGRAPIHIAQSCGTIDRAEEVIREHVASHGVRAVVVDYTQILRTRGNRARHEEVTNVSIRLRTLTTRHGIATLAVCQLNREVDKRDSRRAKLCDLGDSGQLERDADTVLALHWPWKDNPTHTPEDEYVIHVLKRRNGPINSPTIKARFDAKTQTIR